MVYADDRQRRCCFNRGKTYLAIVDDDEWSKLQLSVTRRDRMKRIWNLAPWHGGAVHSPAVRVCAVRHPLPRTVQRPPTR